MPRKIQEYCQMNLPIRKEVLQGIKENARDNGHSLKWLVQTILEEYLEKQAEK